MSAGEKLSHSASPYYAIAAAAPNFRDRHRAIAEAAYFRAERRGFAAGHELDDWLAAETEIRERLISEGQSSS
jgi:hypothetical protein